MTTLEPNFSEIQTSIDQAAKDSGNSDRVNFSFEKKHFQLTLELDEVSEKTIVSTIALAKRHMENWRIHTFDQGFLSIQALNDNLFSNDHILDNIKIRLSGIYGEKMLEVSKKGNLTAAELSLIINLIKSFRTTKSGVNLMAQLMDLGCDIFVPDAGKKPAIAGYKTVLNEVREAILIPLEHSDIFQKISEATRAGKNAEKPKAVLFTGPPGVGKTTMARLIASETSLPLVYIPLENILSAYYGESSKRLAAIFDLAAAHPERKMIIFIDEIDSLGLSRSEKIFEATRRMLSVLLRKLDGLESGTSNIIIGATNRKEDLDSALLSRFDSIVDFPLPEREDIEEILKIFARQLSAEERITVAENLLGESPRAIRDICAKAERIAAREIIEQKIAQDSLPSVKHYQEALARKKLQNH